jgi:hypothetical protein
LGVFTIVAFPTVLGLNCVLSGQVVLRLQLAFAVGKGKSLLGVVRAVGLVECLVDLWNPCRHVLLLHQIGCLGLRRTLQIQRGLCFRVVDGILSECILIECGRVLLIQLLDFKDS